MYHSVYFGEKNTWDDWHLIPVSRPVILPPNVKTNYVDIPGADGHSDLTEALTGSVLYKTRTGSLEFYVDNDYREFIEWEHLYSEIMDYLHGKQMKLILEDDPNFYYDGRFNVNTWKSEKDYSRIVIDYDVYPYKTYRYTSAEEWLWDPFDFLIGIVRDYSHIRINGTVTIPVIGSKKTEIPKFFVTLDNENNPIIMRWNKNTSVDYPLQTGLTKFPDIKIGNETVEFTFMGNGIISIDYRGGGL